ncbi:MAG TPA: NADP-dependent oxidoreductase [Streptosporangiaceae bacterium]|nr:NADP-dependent oxidoreductase [Streptosporangiaceae bacterium]
MRAILQETFGGPEVLALAEVDRPEPQGTEILVRVRAAGVNPVDWYTRMGEGYLESLPMTVGWDVAGIVAEVGLGVTRFAPGDAVFGMPWFPREAGAYAEYVTAPSRQFARKPAALSYVEAAGLPLAGLTAWQVLVDAAGVRAGQRVLIAGAAGGVGHLAVQIAKARGAYVIATARAQRHDFVRGLGADEVIDYTQVTVPEVVSDLDAVFDPVGGSPAAWLPAIKPGGTLLPFGGGDDPGLEAAADRGIAVRLVLVEPDGHALEALAALAQAGHLRVHISATLPLADAARAHELGEQRHSPGKIVLEV